METTLESPVLYEVEAIHGTKFDIFNGVNERHFWVKWLNYPSTDNTWEPRSSLINGAHATVIKYEAKMNLFPPNESISESPKAILTHTIQAKKIEKKKHVQTNRKRKEIIKKRKERRKIETPSSSDIDSEDEPIMKFIRKPVQIKNNTASLTAMQFERIPKYTDNIPKSKPLLPQKRKSSAKERITKKRKVATSSECISLLSSSDAEQEETPLDADAMNALTPSTHEEEEHQEQHDTIARNRDRYHPYSKLKHTKINTTCYNCGKRGHLARQCTEQNTMRCFKCYEIGHWAQNCTKNTCNIHSYNIHRIRRKKRNKNKATTNIDIESHMKDILNDIAYPSVYLQTVNCDPFLFTNPPPLEVTDSAMETYSSYGGSLQQKVDKRKKYKHRKDRNRKRKRRHRDKERRKRRHPPPPPICPAYNAYLSADETNDTNANKSMDVDLQMPTINAWKQMWQRRFRIFGCDANIVMPAKEIIHVTNTYEGIYVDDNESESRQSSVPMSISPPLD